MRGEYPILQRWLRQRGFVRPAPSDDDEHFKYTRKPFQANEAVALVIQSLVGRYPNKDFHFSRGSTYIGKYEDDGEVAGLAQTTHDMFRATELAKLLHIPPQEVTLGVRSGHLKIANYDHAFGGLQNGSNGIHSLYDHESRCDYQAITDDEKKSIARRGLKNKRIIDSFLEALDKEAEPLPRIADQIRSYLSESS